MEVNQQQGARSEEPEGQPPADYRVNFFRPRPGFMRREVRLIWIMLAGWAVFTFGFQLLLLLLQRNPAGESGLTATTFFGFPLHFWFTGQFLIVWFIILCFLFNAFVDRLIQKFRRPR